MSVSFDNFSETKMVQSQNKASIDRQKSLKMVRLAELSLTKKRFANSQQKTLLSPIEQVSQKKNKLIRQIKDKLSHIQDVDLSLTQSKRRDDVQNKKIERLQKILQQIKREKIINIQPLIAQNWGFVESNDKKNKKQKLELILKEVSQARREVKVIKAINRKILANEEEENNFERLNSKVQRAESNEYWIQLIKSSHNNPNGLPFRNQRKNDLYEK